MYYHVPNICIPEFFVGVYCLNDVRVIQVPMASSFSGRIVCFYMVLCYFVGKKFGFAPNPYQTRTNPYYFPENLVFISIPRVSSTRTKPVLLVWVWMVPIFPIFHMFMIGFLAS